MRKEKKIYITVESEILDRVFTRKEENNKIVWVDICNKVVATGEYIEDKESETKK